MIVVRHELHENWYLSKFIGLHVEEAWNVCVYQGTKTFENWFQGHQKVKQHIPRGILVTIKCTARSGEFN